MKKFKTLAVVFVFLFCLCGLMTGCDSDSKNDTVKNSVISIKLKYNDNEIPDDSLSVNLSESPLTFTAEVQVTGKASKDFTLTSSDTDIATVSDKTVTLLAEGQTTITATAVGDTTKTHAITLEVTDDTEIPIPPPPTGSVISIKLKYENNEIPDDTLTVLYAANKQLAFTADVVVEGNASTDFTLASSAANRATVSGKTVTLGNSAGQVTITATAVGDSTKKHAITLRTAYTVTINGGTADVAMAIPDQTVTLTPTIPAGKIFIDWTTDPSNIQMLTDNSFKMPSRNATLTSNFDVDKPYYITNNFGEDSSTELLVQWHNYTSDTQTFQYVTGTGDFTGATEIQVQGKKFEAVSPIGAFAARYIFKVHLTDLSPNTTYKYRVGSTGNWSAEFQHTTSKGTNDDFSFIVVADPQSEAHTDMVKTLQAADAFDPSHKFYIFGGDLVDEIGKRPKEIVSYTNAANTFNIKRPLIATQGNHDTYYSTDSGYRFGEATVFNSFVTFPDNGGDTQADKENRSQCYYFYYNNVLFIMLNTLANSTGVTTSNPDWTRQINWLKSVLDNDRNNHLSRYTIVFTHISPFGGQQNNRWLNPETLAAFGKIFTDYGVDIVFAGHDHVYGRSNPIKITVDKFVGTVTDLKNMDDAGNFDSVEGGTIFSIVGATGPKFYEIVKSDVWIPKYYPVRSDDIKPGMFVNVKVTNEKLIVTARITGKTTNLDTYEVEAK